MTWDTICSSRTLTFQKNVFICFKDSPSEMMKCFLFHFKSSLNSQDSYIFVLSFRTCKKTGLIRKIRLISKISQPGQQRITRNILLDISGIKGYQTIQFGQLVEYNKRNIFLPKSCQKRGKETSSRSLFGFWKSFKLGKSKWSAAWSHCILIALKLAYNKNKLF